MLRLLWQELLFRRNAIIGWAIGMASFPLVYIGIYPSVEEQMVQFGDLEIYQAFGMQLQTFGDWVGSVLVLMMALIVAIYAIINGTGTLAAEEEDGRLEMIVTLPLARRQIVLAKALALSIATLLIFIFVGLVTILVFESIKSQLNTDLTALDLFRANMDAWPLVFAMAMISIFLAAFSPNRRTAATIASAILIIGYFGNNLAASSSLLEPFEPLFLFTYLDTTAQGVSQGQELADTLLLLGAGLISLLLALFFFQRRDLTVGLWPWQRLRRPPQSL